MEINKLSKGNLIKYKNKGASILDQLNYNEYLIVCKDKQLIVNILDIQPVELKDSELKSLGFKKGDKIKLKTKTVQSWNTELNGETMKILVDLSEPISLEELTGIENSIPETYKYVHQIQNIFSYILNEVFYFEK